MRCRILCAGLLASVAAGGGSATAADFGVRTVPQQPPPMPTAAAPSYISDWAGFYVGINGGGGWAHEGFDPGFFRTGFALFTPPDSSPHGGVFGGQAGYNWQWGPVVGGLEIDFDGADIRDTQTFFVPGRPNLFTSNDKIDQLASARFRLGYLIFPNWLLYGTAGIGWGHDELTTTSLNPVTGSFTAENSFTNEFGWVAGAGLEWKFADRWFLRGEWLHYDFGRNNQFDVVPFITSGTLFSPPDNVRTTVDVARAALSYKF
jgi:opacity protein-like surface antigen